MSRPKFVTDPSILPPPGKDGAHGRNGRDGERGIDGTGFRYRGEYRRTTEYTVNDVITDGAGSTYLCIQDCRGRDLENARYFALWAARGADGKAGATTVYKFGSPRLVSAMAEIEQLKEQLGESSFGAIEATADVSLNLGDVVFASGDDHISAAQANNLATAVPVGVTVEDIAADQVGRYVATGLVTNPNWNLVVNSPYYLSPDVPGGISAIPPDNPGLFVVEIGKAISPTRLLVEIHLSYSIG